MIDDIRPQKAAMRKEMIDIRKALSPEEKDRLDKKIQNRVFNLWSFRDEEIILCYASKDIEVSTSLIIETALKLGKRVAAPRCVPGTRNMNFHFINSEDDLEKGAFGVMEPREECEIVKDLSKGLCIVPALLFDLSGYRLGYGKGYYDRFLSRFGGVCIGIAYSFCVKESLPHGKFDRSVDMVITEKENYNCTN